MIVKRNQTTMVGIVPVARLCAVLMAFFLTGCDTLLVKEQPDDPAFAPVVVEQKKSRPLSVGSLYHPRPALSLFGDRRAYKVGDIITVQLNERTVSSKSAETSIEKDADVSFGEDTILGRAVNFKGHSLLTGLDQQRGFDGSAEADQENRLTGSIAVTVSDVLPNGLLAIRGEKWMTLTNGREFIRISGLVRPEDVSGDNSVASTQVADARISYSGTGAFADANQSGWMSRFFNSVVWPF